jgi:twinkle protein
MADIVTVKRMLADRAQSVAEMLLPNGRKEGQEWRAGSTAGEKGQSLGVHLSGQKAGIWQDFSTGEGGDLLDLWIAAKGGTLPEALDAARNWLGLSRPEPYRQPTRTYTRPNKPVCTPLRGHPLDYLREDRNIPGDILAKYKVASNGDEIIFPFLLPDGQLALAKSRKAEDGAKPKPTAADCEPVLFGWQAIPSHAREVVITEGEIDALSWAAYGYPAMSVPFGGGKGAKQQWIESEFERLERFERIYISTDMDKPGEEAAHEIAGRLGRHRCYRVSLPHKDANECLVNGIVKDVIDSAIRGAKNLDPEGLKRASDYTDKVVQLFWPSHEERSGYTVPYSKLSDRLHFRKSEVTLWSGASGSGKSQIISDCIPHWIKQGSRICLASLEMKGEQTLRRMVKQTGGLDRPTAKYLDRILGWLDQGLLLYERVGKASVSALLEVFDYGRAKYGCDQFVIDSLMRLGIAADDYTGQEKAVFQIVDWAVQHEVHLHLVAHARKSEKGQGAPETEDIKGAMEIGANAFNILTVWRNRRHEEELQAAATEALRADIDQKPGVILNVAKQRNGDFEGKVGLWFDQDTYRYHSSFDRGVWDRRFLPPAPHNESEAA